MPFSLMPLPFGKKDLEPIMSEETLSYHHGKHHAAYAKKLGELIEGKAEFGKAGLVDVIRVADEKKDKPLFNNAAQLWNHNFFWHSLAPDTGQEPEGELAELIAASFGSTDALLKSMQEEAVAHFSNGWVWLLEDGGKLKIQSFHDAETPAADESAKPLLTIDIWEHAYYIDYRNARPDYAEKTLGALVNWSFAAQNLDGKGISRADQKQD